MTHAPTAPNDTTSPHPAHSERLYRQHLMLIAPGNKPKPVQRLPLATFCTQPVMVSKWPVLGLHAARPGPGVVPRRSRTRHWSSGRRYVRHRGVKPVVPEGKAASMTCSTRIVTTRSFPVVVPGAQPHLDRSGKLFCASGFQPTRSSCPPSRTSGTGDHEHPSPAFESCRDNQAESIVVTYDRFDRKRCLLQNGTIREAARRGVKNCSSASRLFGSGTERVSTRLCSAKARTPGDIRPSCLSSSNDPSLGKVGPTRMSCPPRKVARLPRHDRVLAAWAIRADVPLLQNRGDEFA